MKLYKHLIFDISNLYIRAYRGCPNKQEAPNLAANMLKKLIREFAGPSCSFYFLCDNWGGNPSSNFISARKQIDSNYKGNRKYDPAIKQGILIFQQWLKTVPNSCVVQEPQKEADDLVFGVLAKTGKEFCLLISADLDWAVEMTRERHWYNYDKIFTPSEFEKQMGYPAQRNSILLHKTFRGDKADNIPNPNTRIREEDLLRLIRENRELPDIIKNPPQYVREIIQNHTDRLLKNWELLVRI